MTVDWSLAKFKSKIIDNARYLFKNYIDTSKGLDALYNRPEVSTNKTKCFKNYNLVKVTSDTAGQHITAWKIDDASNINKMYVRAKVNVATEWDGVLVLTDSTLENCIFFLITPKSNNSDFRIYFRKNHSDSNIYMESVDLSYNQFYDIEAMIDFRENTISVIRDNIDKNVLTTETLPSFDEIFVGFGSYHSGYIPNVLGKDVFITWE